jgi:hypothetical protein
MRGENTLEINAVSIPRVSLPLWEEDGTNIYTMDSIRKKKLAYEIASALKDLDALQYHELLVEKYSEDFLREMMTKVLTVPEKDIRKSRGALYTSLVKRNANYHSRN